MSPRVLFEQDLETLKNKVSEMESMRRSVMTVWRMEFVRTKKTF